uniref:Uncharacterized protein n=1 Tax=Arundo donax TaxID=35708 RepID=A0A0A8YEC7_ARUDO
MDGMAVWHAFVGIPPRVGDGNGGSSGTR